MTVLWIILGILAALMLVLLCNTALQKAKADKLEGEMPRFSDEELKEYAEGLSRMLQCKTVSVKGSYDDTEFKKLRDTTEELFPLLHANNRRQIVADDCWIYRIPGKDSSRRILLMSHHDVVAADEEWTHEPFGGEIVDGVVYGRGAADTKGSLCGILFAAEALLKEGFVPEVDLYIASSHNEELGGDGITTARDYFKERGITFEVILDEGGAIVDPPLGRMNCEKCAMVAVHEKGRCRIRCTASWASSHVSLTGYKNNPVERMAAFIKDVSKGDLFIRSLNPYTRALFLKLGPYCGFPLNVLFSNLWLFGKLLTKLLPSLNATAGGMVGTTCAFQKIEGGTNEKICTATAMLRNNNKEDLKADLAAMRKLAEKYGIEIEVEYEEYYPPAKMESRAYTYTMEALRKVFPRYPAAPYILPAGTDAWKLTPICDCVLRFAPTRMSNKQLNSIHAADENLDAAAVAEAAEFYRYFVKHYR